MVALGLVWLIFIGFVVIIIKRGKVRRQEQDVNNNNTTKSMPGAILACFLLAFKAFICEENCNSPRSDM